MACIFRVSSPVEMDKVELRWYVRNVSTLGRHANLIDQRCARGVKILDGGNQNNASGKKKLRNRENARCSLLLSNTFLCLPREAVLRGMEERCSSFFRLYAVPKQQKHA